MKTIRENIEGDVGSPEEVFDGLDLFGKENLTYIMFISSVIPYTKLLSDKRLIIFF